MGETGLSGKGATDSERAATKAMKPERNLLIAATGSVATIKMVQMISEFSDDKLPYKFNVRRAMLPLFPFTNCKYFNQIKVIITEHAKHFFELEEVPEHVPILHNRDEWLTWNKRGDPVLHIDLGKWADIMLIAPLSANSLAKIASGICDNLMLCVVRAWDLEKPLFFAPAMNTRMYDHPITREQIDKLIKWGYKEIPCISKTLMCGDTGNGAMAEVSTIVSIVVGTFTMPL
ncbi:phosphopantothenoylcysteine decarboxylase isoform X1 [Drosophila navojoa]|uniref:phosphopantothenoylcysteine decarboxylase isoform X1 n=1 Tax=Drosophila navojoa TaxID=7232 RepID=UPI0011BF0ECF|nr:phosphopantothenoylcysteine decarboxylase isoform X1 [Drosophila navojoa]